MKKNQTGFSAVVVVLITAVIGLAGAVGWLVYDRQKTPKNTTTKSTAPAQSTAAPTVKDETSDWLLFTSKQKTYSFKVPDGWKLTHQTDGDVAYATGQDLTYKAGTKATVTETTGGRDGIYGFFIAFDDKSAEKRDFSSYKNEGEFKTASGLTGTKYSYTVTTEPEAIGPPKDSVEYDYYFVKGDVALYVGYTQVPGAPDSLAVAEKAIKTAQLL